MDESLATRTAKSVFWNVAVLPFQYLLPFISSIVVIRALGTDLYGQLATLTAVATAVSTYTDLGISKSLPKFNAEVLQEYGRSGWQSFILTLCALRLLLAGIILAVFNASEDWFIAFFKIPAQGHLYVRLVSVWIVLQALSGMFSMVLVALFKHREMNLVQLSSRIIGPLLIIGAALAGWGLTGVLVASIVMEAYRVAAMLFGLRREFDLPSVRPFPFRSEASITKRFSLYSAFSYMIVIVRRYFFGVPFMILLMGYYGLHDRIAYLALANKVTALVIGLTNLPLSYTMAPLLGTTFADADYGRMRKAYRLINKLNQIVSVAPSVGVLLLANLLVVAFYGSEYQPAVAPLRIMLGLLAAGGVLAFGSSVLQTYERYRRILISSLIGLVAILVSALLLIPRFMEIGAAASMGIGFCAFQIAATLFGRKDLGLSYPLSMLAKVTAASIPMLTYFPFRQAIDRQPLFALVYMVFSGLAFFAVFKLLGGLEEEDRQALSRIKFPLKRVVMRLLG
ncbi:MAG: oligosaccharide flippase family protein [Anaerolineales bacterium]|jgi:O-antigen/teichoic acid export membrane protein